MGSFVPLREARSGWSCDGRVLRWCGLRFAPFQTPAKVATWHTNIRHLAYVLWSAPILQSY